MAEDLHSNFFEGEYQHQYILTPAVFNYLRSRNFEIRQKLRQVCLHLGYTWESLHFLDLTFFTKEDPMELFEQTLAFRRALMSELAFAAAMLMTLYIINIGC